MFSKKTSIKLSEYPEIDFLPFHQIKKENGGNEPYLKSVEVLNCNFTFFYYGGDCYVLKPTDKKDFSKMLCAKLKNPVAIRSAHGSCTGNCARGLRQEFIDYIGKLFRANLSKEEIFRRVVLNVDNLK